MGSGMLDDYAVQFVPCRKPRDARYPEDGEEADSLPLRFLYGWVTWDAAFSCDGSARKNGIPTEASAMNEIGSRLDIGER
jgi:hypothetical protein